MLAAFELRELLAAVCVQVDGLTIWATAEQHTPATWAVRQAGHTPAATRSGTRTAELC
jgi:hypothetical protein